MGILNDNRQPKEENNNKEDVYVSQVSEFVHMIKVLGLTRSAYVIKNGNQRLDSLLQLLVKINTVLSKQW